MNILLHAYFKLAIFCEQNFDKTIKRQFVDAFGNVEPNSNSAGIYLMGIQII